MKTVIIYGNQPGWVILTNELLYFLQPNINNVKSIKNIHELQLYLLNNSIDINYIIPLTETHFIELNNVNIKAIMPDNLTVQEFTNKQLFAKYVLKNNLTNFFPKIYYKNDYSNKLVVVKPPYGGSSVGVYLDNINNIQNNTFQTHVVQEYIKEDTEYTANLVVDKGKIIYAFAYSRYYGNRNYIKHDVQDNTTQKRVEIAPKHICDFERFLLPVKYTGPCNIDYKIVNNNIFVFEINARLGGSLIFEQHTKDFATMILYLINLKI
jgi:carbamoylphosphate synthase large subunit